MNPEKKPRSLRQAIFLLLLALTVSRLPVSDVSAREITADPRFNEGVYHFERQEYDSAFRIFNELFPKAPGDPELNFLLGRSAFESGNPEAAVFAFERLLIMNPDNQRAKLEMARAYYKMGSLGEAARLFRQVLATNPPESVQTNIQRYLNAIEKFKKRNFLNFMITTGINIDDNLYVSPVEDLVQLPGLGDLPVSMNKAESGYYFPLNLGAFHRYYFESVPVYWKTTVQTYHTRYPGHDDLEVDYFGGSTGCAVNLGRFELGIFPEGYFMLLDSSRYSGAFGTSLQCKYAPGNNQLVELKGEIRHKTFHDNADRDGLETGVEIKYTVPVGRVSVSPVLEFKKEATDNDLYGYDRVGAGITFELPLPYSFSLYGGYLYENDEYKAEDPLFLTTRRDRTHAVSGGIYREFRLTDYLLLLAGIGHTWETVDSTISIYEYDRNVTRIYLSLMF